MKKISKYLICLLVTFSLFGRSVYGELSLGEPVFVGADYGGVFYDLDALVNPSKFKLDNLISEKTKIPAGFKLVTVCGRISSETSDLMDDDICKISNGDDDLVGDYAGYGVVLKKNKAIVYTGEGNIALSNLVGSSLVSVPGEIILTFKDAVTLNDGRGANIEMTIDNIKLRLKKNVLGKPLLILKQGDYSMGMGADSAGDLFSASYDVAFKLKRSVGGVIQNKTWGIIFSDLDVYISDCCSDVIESIELLYGVKAGTSVYRIEATNPDNYLTITDNYTKYATTLRNTEVGGLVDNESRKAGFGVIISSDGFKYRWTGTECATDIGFLTIENPESGNVSKVIMVFALLIVSSLVMFIFLRKVTKYS